jgi:Mce-associated membrane protein
LSDDLGIYDVTPQPAVAGGPGVTSVRQGEPTGRWRTLAPWVAAALAVLCVALAAVVVTYGVRDVFLSPAGTSDRDAAVAAARRAATDFSTYDYNHVQAQFAHLKTIATGASMQKQIDQSLASVVPLLQAGKATAKGVVRDTAVAQAHGKQVSVLAVVDQTVANTAIPKGALRRYRFLLVMSQVHGRWLVSDLEQA